MAKPQYMGTNPDNMCQHLDMEDAVLLLWSMVLEKQLFQSFVAHLWGGTSLCSAFKSRHKLRNFTQRKDDLVLGAKDEPLANLGFGPFTL